ncbi:MAG: efflux transporter outer membrane subunit [Methylococcaceae bacterium]|nr:MAG: efflux transporter outer membrane subunit [Methylococcaceae bacterium]
MMTLHTACIRSNTVRLRGLLVLMSSVFLALSACTLGPDFTRPEPPKVAHYGAEALAAKAIVLGKTLPGQWWTLYHSEALTKLIQHAIAHNPDLHSAHAALRQAEAMVLVKKSSLLPTLDASAFSTKQQISGAQFGNPNAGSSVFSLYNASVKVSYTLDVFGAIRRQIETLSAQVEYQQFELEAVFLTLSANIVTTVFQEASLRAQLLTSNELLTAQQQQLATIEQQFALGSVPKSIVLAQRVLVAQTQSSLPALQHALTTTRHQLSVLVGTLPDAEPLAEFSLDDFILPTPLPVSLPAQLVTQRPDIRAQEAIFHAASAQIGVVMASVFPDFTISANMGSIATQAAGVFTPGSEIWSMTANMLQPVFHGGDFTHKRQAAVASYQQAAENYRSKVLSAFQDVADTLSALHYDAETLASQEAEVNAATENLSLTDAQFGLGSVSYLSLLSAQQNVQRARLNKIKAQTMRLADSAALFQALGGGWWQRGNLSYSLKKQLAAETKPCEFFTCLVNPLPTPK